MNRLTLDVDKTFYMIFHRKRIKTDNLKLTIGQGTLTQTSQCKYLGLIIVNKLMGRLGQSFISIRLVLIAVFK